MLTLKDAMVSAAATLPVTEPKREPTGAVYGIIDPDYGRVYTIARKLAWEEGYAIGLHGSFTRDLDMIAVPWADTACEPEHLIRRIADAAGLKVRDGVGIKPHGRLAWTLFFPAFGDPRFVDLSIMPRVLSDSQPERQPLTEEQIDEIGDPFGYFKFGDAQGDKRRAFVRAIENFHGIGYGKAIKGGPVSEPRPCTCHPDDNPPVPCAQKYALNECRATRSGPARGTTGVERPHSRAT